MCTAAPKPFSDVLRSASSERSSKPRSRKSARSSATPSSLAATPIASSLALAPLSSKTSSLAAAHHSSSTASMALYTDLRGEKPLTTFRTQGLVSPPNFGQLHTNPMHPADHFRLPNFAHLRNKIQGLRHSDIATPAESASKEGKTVTDDFETLHKMGISKAHGQVWDARRIHNLDNTCYLGHQEVPELHPTSTSCRAHSSAPIFTLPLLKPSS